MAVIYQNGLPINAGTPSTTDEGLVVKVAASGATGTSSTQVQGTAASDAPVVGNPLQGGGRASTDRPTAVSADGDSVALWLSRTGTTIVGGIGGSGGDGVTNNAHIRLSDEGISSGLLENASYLFNDSTWDRPRNNTDITVLASAARTATTNSADITNYNGRGLHLVIDVTAITATPSVVFTIQGKGALSGQYYTVLASAAITGVGTTVLRVFPGSTVTANLAANDILPRTWRINAVHGDADSITYSCGASIIL